MIADLSPGLVLILGAILVPFLPGRLRTAWTLALPVLAYLQLAGFAPGAHGQLEVFELALTTVRVDALSLAFGHVFLLGLFIGTIYHMHVPDALQPTATLVYGGSALGAIFAGDLVTLFLFWEGTSIASVFLILAARTERALAISLRYLVMMVGSGVLLLAGAMIHLAQTGSIAFDALGITGAGGTLFLLAFGIKAAFPLLHGWLKDGYPEATVTGTVILSIFTTKLAIYALARGFAGTEVLVPIGVVMAVFPIFWAMLESDYRRVLAWGLNSQLGFMVVGIGIGTDLSINGAVAHAMCSVIYQGLLFMAMGAVLFRTGTAQGAELGGLARRMPWTFAFYLVGAASIAALPLFSGFVSKAMTVSAAGYKEMFWPWALLVAAGAGTTVYAGLRIPFGAFLGAPGPTCATAREAPRNMLVAMALASAVSLAIGVWPELLYSQLPRDYAYNSWTLEHVLTQLQLMALAALVFAVFWRLGLFPREVRGAHADPDRILRIPLRGAGWSILAGVMDAWNGFFGRGQAATVRLARALAGYHGPDGALARTRPSGSMAFWMTLLLLAFLAFSFV